MSDPAIKNKMTRFIGIKNNFIYVVSEKQFSNKDFEVVELPQEFNHVSAEELITNYRYSNGELKSKKVSKPIQELKIAFVGNFKMRCGISTYAENLWPEVAKHAKDFKLFVEENDFPTGNISDFGNEKLNEDQYIVCWKRGGTLNRLVDEIKNYDPDIILISHEFGLWPVATYWLSMMTQLSQYRIITTMHSVFHHRDKTICEEAMPEIIVHLEGARKVLKEEKQISGKVHVIPHGCYTLNTNKLWNIYKTKNTVIQTGFLYHYKNWSGSLRAIAHLKKSLPDVYFTGICSESPFNAVEHQLYFNELMDLIQELGIEDNVCLLRGYKSDSVLNSFFETNNVAIFPYSSPKEHEVFGVSGAARLAMSKNLPIITSNGNHFQDIPSIKCSSPEEMSNAMLKLLTDRQAYAEQISKQKEYMLENTWEKVAAAYIKVFEGI